MGKFCASGDEWKILLGNFFIEWWEPEEEWFWPFKPFLKLKTTFCKYWRLIKIKISKTCVYKVYEFKIKMAQEQWLKLKRKFLLGYNIKVAIQWDVGINLWWGRLPEGVIFPDGVGGNEQIFGYWVTPLDPPVGKTLKSILFVNIKCCPSILD